MAVSAKPEPQDATLPPPKPPPSAGDKSKALAALSKHRRVIAWSIHRWPLERRILHSRTRIHLPRSYLSMHGSDVRAVWPGADINQLVYQYYLQLPDRTGADGQQADAAGPENGKGKEDRSGWANYVAADGILPHKHEFLGPDPRVAGYHIDVDGEIHIKWYDGFLQDQWMDKQKWKFDVRLDENGKWVEVDDW